jgi:hypothetical protein
MTDRLPSMRKVFEEFLKKREGASSFVRKTFSLGAQCDTIPNAKGKFGYDKSNPIPVCSPSGEMEYLRSLWCKCGEPFDFRRLVMGRVRTDMLLTALSWFVKPKSIKLPSMWTCTIPAPVPWFRKNLEKPTGD